MRAEAGPDHVVGAGAGQGGAADVVSETARVALVVAPAPAPRQQPSVHCRHTGGRDRG